MGRSRSSQSNSGVNVASLDRNVVSDISPIAIVKWLSLIYKTFCVIGCIKHFMQGFVFKERNQSNETLIYSDNNSWRSNGKKWTGT